MTIIKIFTYTIPPPTGASAFENDNKVVAKPLAVAL
jgi:hypothetical protein